MAIVGFAVQSRIIPPMPRTLQNMVVVITGVSAGIGKTLAERLSARGAKLVLAARRLDKLESLNASLGGNHLCVRCDVGNPSDCKTLIDRSIENFSRIDTLVCNAGYGLIRPVAETSEQEMLDIFRTNVFGTTDCIRAAVSYMKLQPSIDHYRAQIMIVSSAAARRGLPYFGAYAATKAAQLSLAEALRVEMKPHRIAVTSVHPVGTKTDFFTSAEQSSGRKIESPMRKNGMRQSVETVAARMLKAVESPVAELWPHRPSRFALTLSTLLPSVVDRVMGKMMKEIDEANRQT